MRLISWNIQWGKGCDGRVDLARIVATAREFGDPDVLCLQEVSHGFEALDGGVDQPAALAELLPGFTPVFRAAVDITGPDGAPGRFGNMVLSRLPVIHVASHLLPRPPEPRARSMRRQALEVIVRAGWGPVRVVTTHLEYYSLEHRAVQVERLRALHAELAARPMPDIAPDPAAGPYAAVASPRSTVLCGDFNLIPADPLHAEMLRPFPNGIPAFVDAWSVVHPGEPHAPTCGIGDREQWKEGPHCRDFVFVTDDIAPRVERIEVETDTTASDHQPVLLELRD